MADWYEFRKIVSEKVDPINLTSKQGRANYFDMYLSEVNDWMSGEQLRLNNPKVDETTKEVKWLGAGFPITTNNHDESCPIYNSIGINEKRKKLVELSKRDPRWIFDKCGVVIFFQAIHEKDFVFFKKLGKSLVSNNFPTPKKELENLKWYVWSRFPIAAYLCYSIEEREETLKKILGKIYVEVISIIDQNPSIKNLRGKPTMKDETAFFKTARTWYRRDLKKSVKVDKIEQ